MLAAQDNLLHGRFLAELTQEVLTDLEASKYQHAEYRISIYGRKRVEWDILAAWICQNQLYSDNVVWLIQARRRPVWLCHKVWAAGSLGSPLGSSRHARARRPCFAHWLRVCGFARWGCRHRTSGCCCAHVSAQIPVYPAMLFKRALGCLLRFVRLPLLHFRG